MPLGKESGIVPRVLDWLKILRWLRWEFPTLINRFVFIIFFSFSQIIAMSLNQFSPLFQVFPMLEILAKELCSNGPVQISVGIRVDRSIYQVKCETKVTNHHRWFKTTLFKVRGYKPAPVAWPMMSEEVDDLGKRMSRCQIFVFKVLDGRWSGIRYLCEVISVLVSGIYVLVQMCLR